MNKFFPILLVLIILLAPLGLVLAVGESCCSDGNCTSPEQCLCEPSSDCTITDGKVTAGKAGICGPSGNIVLCPPTSIRSIEDLIENITDWIYWIAIAVAPIIILIAGFMFVTAAGDPNKVNKAKKIIFWTAIGLGIILFSKGIYTIIKSILGV